jgi:hypothetical protein
MGLKYRTNISDKHKPKKKKTMIQHTKTETTNKQTVSKESEVTLTQREWPPKK